ncbi:hypothetical protein SCLCIDRAFT_1212432 [Scleroderma citrinum Foug A]|uniref:Uncharacterized protein n=1 Tax=Scleroderma citrinum Foug A TaxID=1036808 RepID=A0A0C2ZUU8_9AGAM|nr:hypothetical protein SCLCIDRAFT_1212432 [Scleroderma citrinum Foug A]
MSSQLYYPPPSHAPPPGRAPSLRIADNTMPCYIPRPDTPDPEPTVRLRGCSTCMHATHLLVNAP